MLRNLFLCLSLSFTLFNFSFANDEKDLVKVLKSIAPALNTAGTVNYKEGCANCAHSAKAKERATLYSKDNDQKIELSLLTEAEAKGAFNEIAARKDIPFEYPDGCYARAHKMVLILEKSGIISGKAFIEGELNVDTKFGEVSWGYHVAPVIMVKKDSKIIPYVFDPSLFKAPVPQSEWIAKIMAKPSSTLSREYYTNRFAYDPRDRTEKYKEHVEEFLIDAEEVNNHNTQLLERLKDYIEYKKTTVH